MDHIPKPQNPLPEISVRLVEPIIPYDYGNFASFPLRHVFTENSTRDMASIEIARYLQSWLFFGLLAESLESGFRLPDLVTWSDDRSAGSFLTLKKLQSRLVDGTGRPSFLTRWNEHIEATCTLAWTVVNRMESFGLLATSPAGETALAVLVLVRTLQITAVGPSRDEVKISPWSSEFLRAHMQKGGWCPQQIAALFDAHDPIVVYYLARLRGQEHALSHNSCNETACIANNVTLNREYQHRHTSDHCTCDFTSTDANEVKAIIRGGGIPLISIQKEEHARASLKITKASPGCDYVAVSHVWSDGLGNPNANALPQCQLERLSRCLSQMPRGSYGSNSDSYMSRGLELNASPVRQKTFLEYFSNTGFQDSSRNQRLIWMDTLCIPVVASDDSPAVVSDVNRLKMTAINQMALVYAGASQVLVLDSGLQSIVLNPSHALSDIEGLARFICSTWMRRCWTLQEGALARKIYFPCASGMATPLTPTKSSLDDYSIEVANGLVPWILPWYIQIHLRKRATSQAEKVAYQVSCAEPILAHLRYRFQEAADRVINLLPRGLLSHNTLGQATPESQLRQFCTIWNSLADRNTTMTEDIPALFANLLDINAYQILALHGSLRMKALLMKLDVLPLGLLFNDGPRSEASSNCLDRWVPSKPSRTTMRVPEPDPFDEDLAVRTALSWTEDGNLKYSNQGGTAAILLDVTDIWKDKTEFILRIDEPLSPGRSKDFLIHLQRPEVDDMQREVFPKAMLVLEVENTVKLSYVARKGCLLFVKEDDDLKNQERIGIAAERQETNIVGQYDCPLTWNDAAPIDVDKYPSIFGQHIKSEWILTVQCGNFAQFSLKRYGSMYYLLQNSDSEYPVYQHWSSDFSRRSFHQTLSNFVQGIAALFVVVPLSYCNLISIVLRVIIQIRIGWVALSPLGKAATIMFALDASQVFSFLTPPPIAQTLFIIDRQRTVGSLSSIEKAHVILSLVGNLWSAVVIFRLVNGGLRYLAYRAWLETFRDDWPAERSWVWYFYFWIANSSSRAERTTI